MKVYTQLAVMAVFSSLLLACDKNQNIIANIDDKKISQSSFDAFLALKNVNKKDTKQVEAYLSQYLEREAMAAAVEKSNFLSAEKVDAELNEFKKEMLISRYFEQYLKEQVSDTAIRNYYAANSEKFESKRARVAHILIRTNKNMTELERKAKFTRAHEAYSKLKSGEDFSIVVDEFSEDTISAKKDGELGWINEGAIDPIFSKTAFSQLKVGEISEPFQSAFGFHIVKLLASPAIIKKPLEKVKGDIRFQLRKKVKNEEIERLMNSVKVTQI